jgi:hypothetical protein
MKLSKKTEMFYLWLGFILWVLFIAFALGVIVWRIFLYSPGG